MNRFFIIFAALFALLLAGCLVSCESDLPAEPTAEVTPAPTDAPTDPVAEAPTEAPTDPVTEAPTEAPTEAETLPPSEVLAEKLRAQSEWRARTKRIGVIPNDGVSTTVQGGYTDGKYHYQLFIQKDTASNEENNIVRLVQYDLESGEQVQVSDPLPLNHANDLTYNPKRGVFVAVHNNPHRKWVSLIDPETLTITETIQLDDKIYSISYNESRDQIGRAHV